MPTPITKNCRILPISCVLPISCWSFCLSKASLTSMCEETLPSSLACNDVRSVVFVDTWFRSKSTALEMIKFNDYHLSLMQYNFCFGAFNFWTRN